MQAGNMDKRIVLQKPTRTIDVNGADMPSWADDGTVWAEEIPLSVRLRVSAPQVMPVRVSTFRIRKRSVGEDWRISYDGAHWKINGIAPSRFAGMIELFAEATG